VTFSLPFLTSWLKVGIVFLLSSVFFRAAGCPPAPPRELGFTGVSAGAAAALSFGEARIIPSRIQSTQVVIIAKEKGDVKIFLPFSQIFFSFFGCFAGMPPAPQDVVVRFAFMRTGMADAVRPGNFPLAFCRFLYYCCVRDISLCGECSVFLPCFFVSFQSCPFFRTDCML
jgi:hypothetical protein